MTPPPDPTGPLVLYVDDERANRVVFDKSFANRFRIKTASDGAEALEVLRQEPVAVLLTDQRMPGMSGDELLRIVKRDHPEVVRVVITAYSDIEPILAAINEGLVARYIVKPWNREELDQLLRWAIAAWQFSRDSSALQHRLLETERLATLGSIVGAVVHDLNQPVAGMVMNCERLAYLVQALPVITQIAATADLSAKERSLIEHLTSELPEIVEDLQMSAAHMRGMTQDLHAFLRGTRREADVATPPVPIIRHALGVCQEVAIRARGLLRYDGPDTLPAVRMSSTELTQVLINVVTNAAQSLGAKSAGEGNVVVRAESVAGQIAFTVTDNGPGIPPEVLAKIGTPFFTTKDKGTGLGIAQCQRLVGKAGGQFRIASEPGKGTTVSFSIPVR
ncbi:MAG: response regulator [Kofleriaceae bacterium]|jgi:signal transduction histidine kinase|nr:response regulator [Kofleriaceae bacterium]MBP9170368.1 response regulator [Kofleriaceae bacterium]MBP9860070.1 response regulator [Kofleriaceae bacterium]